MSNLLAVGADGDRALEFVHRVRELCEQFGMTIVAPHWKDKTSIATEHRVGSFDLGIITGPLAGSKVGRLRHISPWFAEIDRGDGIFRTVK